MNHCEGKRSSSQHQAGFWDSEKYESGGGQDRGEREAVGGGVQKAVPQAVNDSWL